MGEDTKSIFEYKLYGLEADYEPLPLEEQIKLVKLYRKDRSKKYLNTLIQSNFKFIIHMVKQYRGGGLSDGDLVTIAYTGFKRAVEKYKYGSKKTLVNYAALWIKQKIRKAQIDNFSLIRMPIGMWKTIATLNRLINEGKDDKQIMKEMRITHLRLIELKRFRLSFDTYHCRLNQEVVEGEDIIIDLACEDEVHKKMVKADRHHALLDVVHMLGEQERDIITKRFGLDGHMPMTLEEIGKMYGRSRERIRQIESHALSKLRKHVEKRGI